MTGFKKEDKTSGEVFNERTQRKSHSHQCSFGRRINVSIFFSRYHDAIKTYADMKKEIYGIFRLKHDIFGSGIENVHIAYDHLSTDVASRYWESYVERPRDFDTLISAIRKLSISGEIQLPCG